jgi:hypothetical protein
VAPGLGLPGRLAASVVNSIDAAGQLPLFQQRLLEEAGAMRQGIWRLEGSVRQLELRVLQIEQSVTKIADLTPDPDTPGPIAKAKEAITGRGERAETA